MSELFCKCAGCEAVISRIELAANIYACPHCGYYMPMPARERVASVLDEGSFEELFADVGFSDSIGFPGYREKYEKEARKSGLNEAIVTGRGRIEGQSLCIGVMDSSFMMGSMGRAVGEKVTLLMEQAVRDSVPLVLFTASGGARMQEGIVSLMQMAKTSAAVEALNRAGLLYATVLTNPTTGGVSASFAMLGDVTLAEPKALVCFAGPRVVRQTVKTELPENFQIAEDVMKHGFIDAIVPRRELRRTLSFLLRTHRKEENGQ